MECPWRLLRGAAGGPRRQAVERQTGAGPRTMCHRRSRNATALGSLGRFSQAGFDLRRHCVWRRDASPKESPDL